MSIQIARLCNNVQELLSEYYGFENKICIDHFLLEPSQELGQSGRVLIEQDEKSNELFLGLQFGTGLHFQIESQIESNENSNRISLHSLAVVAEETSHFRVIVDANEADKLVAIRDLEVLGEIDRFLVLLHWNHYFSGDLKLPVEWQNLHDVCDSVFTGNRFTQNTNPLYFEAETIALRYLKIIFKEQWNNTYFDFSKIYSNASQRALELRQSIFLPRFSSTESDLQRCG